jgi:hypothetical protein
MNNKWINMTVLRAQIGGFVPFIFSFDESLIISERTK